MLRLANDPMYAYRRLKAHRDGQQETAAVVASPPHPWMISQSTIMLWWLSAHLAGDPATAVVQGASTDAVTAVHEKVTTHLMADSKLTPGNNNVKKKGTAWAWRLRSQPLNPSWRAW